MCWCVCVLNNVYACVCVCVGTVFVRVSDCTHHTLYHTRLLHLTIHVFQALLELWHVGVLKKFDEEKLLVRAEAARL